MSIIEQYNNELYHYGVKGMKWGVRRYDDDIIVKKGTMTQRVSDSDEKARNKAERKYNKNRERTYVSFTDEDNKFYTKAMTDHRKSQYDDIDPSKIQTYTVKYKAKHDLRSPSQQRRIDEFVKLYDDMKDVMVNELASAAMMKKHADLDSIPMKKYMQESKAYIKKFSNMKMSELRSKGYEQFVYMLEDSSGVNKSATEYKNRLRKQGYNALIDDNDVIGNGRKSPLIVFDPSKNLKRTSAKVITDEQYKAAEEYVNSLKKS